MRLTFASLLLQEGASTTQVIHQRGHRDASIYATHPCGLAAGSDEPKLVDALDDAAARGPGRRHKHSTTAIKSC